MTRARRLRLDDTPAGERADRGASCLTCPHHSGTIHDEGICTAVLPVGRKPPTVKDYRTFICDLHPERLAAHLRRARPVPEPATVQNPAPNAPGGDWRPFSPADPLWRRAGHSHPCMVLSPGGDVGMPTDPWTLEAEADWSGWWALPIPRLPAEFFTTYHEDGGRIVDEGDRLVVTDERGTVVYADPGDDMSAWSDTELAAEMQRQDDPSIRARPTLPRRRG